MCTFVRLEYLIANALVELYDNGGISKISYTNIKKYGLKVAKYLSKTTGSKVVLLCSNRYLKEFAEEYSNFFNVEGTSISIRQEITVDDIWEGILSYAPMNVLRALLSKKNLDAIYTL